jgi:uncharacterized MAPEG superfamily protein
MMSFNVEMQMLVWTVLLGFVHIVLGAMTMTAQRGSQWNMGARDSEGKRLTGYAGRLDRALSNFKETFPLFAAAVLLIAVSGRSSSISVLGAQMYFFARLIYLPVYAFGWPYIRTLIWGVASLGIVLVLVPMLG